MKEKITHSGLKVPVEIVVWIYNTSDNNLGFKSAHS